MRFALDVGANIEDQRVAVVLGHDGGQSRTVDTLDHAQRRLGGDPRRTGVAGGHHGRGRAIVDQLGAQVQGRSLLAPEDADRRVLHAHHVRRIDQLEARWEHPEPSQLATQPLLGPDQQNRNPEVSDRLEHAPDNGPRRSIATHRIDGDGTFSPHISPCVAPACRLEMHRRDPESRVAGTTRPRA